jgi:hypothetical protein
MEGSFLKDFHSDFKNDLKIINDLFEYSKSLEKLEILSFTLSQLSILVSEFKKKANFQNHQYDNHKIENIISFIRMKKLEILDKKIPDSNKELFHVEPEQEEENQSLLYQHGEIIYIEETNKQKENKHLQKIAEKYLHINEATLKMNKIVKDSGKQLKDFENHFEKNINDKIFKGNQQLDKFLKKKQIINKKKYYFVLITVFFIFIFWLSFFYDLQEKGKNLYFNYFY